MAFEKVSAEVQLFQKPMQELNLKRKLFKSPIWENLPVF